MGLTNWLRDRREQWDAAAEARAEVQLERSALRRRENDQQLRTTTINLAVREARRQLQDLLHDRYGFVFRPTDESATLRASLEGPDVDDRYTVRLEDFRQRGMAVQFAVAPNTGVLTPRPLRRSPSLMRVLASDGVPAAPAPAPQRIENIHGLVEFLRAYDHDGEEYDEQSNSWRPVA